MVKLSSFIPVRLSPKMTGIVFLLICLLVVLFIGQWMNLGYFGKMGSSREGLKSSNKPSTTNTKKPKTTQGPGTTQVRTTQVRTTKVPKSTKVPKDTKGPKSTKGPNTTSAP